MYVIQTVTNWIFVEKEDWRKNHPNKMPDTYVSYAGLDTMTITRAHILDINAGKMMHAKNITVDCSKIVCVFEVNESGEEE